MKRDETGFFYYLTKMDQMACCFKDQLQIFCPWRKDMMWILSFLMTFGLSRLYQKFLEETCFEEDRAMQSQVFILLTKVFLFFPNKHVWIESELNLLWAIMFCHLIVLSFSLIHDGLCTSWLILTSENVPLFAFKIFDIGAAVRTEDLRSQYEKLYLLGFHCATVIQ
jgi:hypothetical protein